MHGQPPIGMNAQLAVHRKPDNVEQVGTREVRAEHEVGAGRSGARKNGNYLIREIMKSKRMTQPEASKHIKVNNLYSNILMIFL